MKIIFLTDEIYPDIIGGAGLSTFLLAKALVEEGQQLLIISATEKSEKDGLRIKIEGVEIEYIHVGFIRRLRTIRGLYNHRVVSRIKKIFINIRPDVIHIHNVSYLLSFYTIAIAKKYAKAVFFTARDTMSFTYGKFDWFIDRKNLNVQKDFDYKVKIIDLVKQARKSYLPFRNYLIRRWLNCCQAVFAISQELKKALEQNGIKNVVAVCNSINVNDFDVIGTEEIDAFKKRFSLFGKKVLFSAGRLSKLKGAYLIIEMMEIINHDFPEAVLALAVEERLAKKLRDFAQAKGVGDNIVFYGWLDAKTMRVAYKASDVCLVPSIYMDPFNRINIEAMAAKKPVVGTCFGGTPEIVVDGQTGFIVNPLNIKMMANYVCRLLKNPELSKSFGEAGYRRAAELFNLSKIARETVVFYEK